MTEKMEKIQMTLSGDVHDRGDGKNSKWLKLFILSKWKKEQWQNFDLNQNVAILGNCNSLLC